MSDLSEIYATYSDLWYPRGAEDHNDRFPKSPCQEEPEHAKPCLGGQVDDKAPSSPLPPSLAASSTSASVRSTHTLYSSFEDVGSIPDGSYHGNGSAKARSGGPSVRGKLRSKSVAVLRHVRSLVHAPLRFTSHRPPPSGKQQGIAAYRNTAEFVPIDNTHIATSFLGSEPGDLNCISLVSPNRKYLVRGIAASKGSQPELSGPQRARWSESRGQWVISKPIGGLSAQVSAADKKKLRPIKDMQGWWEDIMRGIQHGKLVMSGEGKPPAACHQWSQPQPCGSERGEAVFITLPEHMYLAPQTPGLYKSGAMAAVTTGSLPVALHSNSDLARPASTPAGRVKRSSESLRLHCTAAAVGCSPIGECSPSSSTATPLSLNSEWGEDCTGGPAEWTLGDTENTIGGSSSSYAEPILKSPPCAQDEHASGHLKGSPKHRLALGRTIITSVRSKLTHLASSLAKPPPSGVEISLPSQVGQAVSPHSEPSPCEPRSKAGGITVPSTGIEARSPIATSAMNSLAAGLKRMTNRWNAK
ncbi:hypothetical protein EV182_002404 [Spiromyces aspiralis]|uniref:Uncharacterized protein n=1 Tax=Spiromyces aspiralis TaxID=68401 RepID=A0ACC1HY00_9FUNG|nr:hypothetical protein EV182_002404 [Spiromyces aspiralis]